MTKSIVIILLISVAWGLAYYLGKSNCEVKTLIQEKKVIQYVEQKKSAIYSRPNADRTELLKLMHNNQL